MSVLASDVELCEVGPRDGFQFEPTVLPTEVKLRVIELLRAAGLRRIQVTSFVHPTRVPQMADAERLIAQLPDDPNAIFSGLALNRRGVERAAASGLSFVDLSIATNERHSRDNANMSVAEGIVHAEEMIELAHSRELFPQLNLQTVFGYAQPGDTPLQFVLDLARRFRDAGLESFSLADSTGMANPHTVRDIVRAVQDELGDVPLVLHLHDTRGLGLANVYAAILEGVRRFDVSVGGLGGCPFIPGATGNIATEDTAYLLNALHLETGVDPALVAKCTRFLEDFLKRGLPGRYLHSRRD
jgi:hydroxymethylglutaryl-CoA lyase